MRKVLFLCLFGVWLASSYAADSIKVTSSELIGTWKLISTQFPGQNTAIPAQTPVSFEFSSDGKMVEHLGVHQLHWNYTIEESGITMVNKVVANREFNSKWEVLEKTSNKMTIKNHLGIIRIEKTD